MGDPDPDGIRDTFKGWATRALKKLRPLPPNGAFWTEKGSVRKVSDEAALKAAVVYVARKQPKPLSTWWDPRWQELLDDYDLASRTP